MKLLFKPLALKGKNFLKHMRNKKRREHIVSFGIMGLREIT